ncbi:GAF domain-containing protein [Kribbella sp. VKM Ac-2569]|uniref:GAF and ANTAR domain-containing protein n=1 Tax=Kribbella sp. VKM Ac-2569 TaxID=2512220 RepID=UPI00102BD837|nr:GAF and ANTAR domain-containing protein [Kribbella sp. VKM Ac-2569]RZT16796.1 GAF domain-containing protein [Kribbella sp. VKM Ac-2569]
MTATTASQAFIDAAAAIVQQDDIADILVRLLSDCAGLTGAGAIGLLVKDGHGRLEILSATSHQAVELELYQLQHDTGPCVDAARDGASQSVRSPGEVIARWGTVGEAIVAAGFHAVHAVPLRWHGRLIGAMNAFHTDVESADDDSLQLTQAFADIATVVIVHPVVLTGSELDERVRVVLDGRTVVEQAKGVLAESSGVDVATAYQLLVQRAVQNGSTLTEAATTIIEEAQRRT